MSRLPLSDLTPTLPPPLSFPFYYASLQCLWVFWETPLEAAEAALGRAADFDTKLEPTRFACSQGGETAGVVLNFQRYTAHLPNGLATTNEVEFNLLCQPRSAATTPILSLGEYMEGADQTGQIGQLRLHVAADNEFAVWAGREGFGENKFLTKFLYTAPTLNDPAQSPNWRTALYRPDQIETKDGMDAAKDGEADKFLYDLTADFGATRFKQVTATPLTEFALGLGRTVVTRWTLLGTFGVATFRGGASSPVGFAMGPAQKDEPEDFAKMRVDLEGLVAGRAAYGAQTFDPPPVCVEPPGWFLDA
jgi:hypothetical protein